MINDGLAQQWAGKELAHYGTENNPSLVIARRMPGRGQRYYLTYLCLNKFGGGYHAERDELRFLNVQYDPAQHNELVYAHAPTMTFGEVTIHVGDRVCVRTMISQRPLRITGIEHGVVFFENNEHLARSDIQTALTHGAILQNEGREG